VCRLYLTLISLNLGIAQGVLLEGNSRRNVTLKFKTLYLSTVTDAAGSRWIAFGTLFWHFLSPTIQVGGRFFPCFAWPACDPATGKRCDAPWAVVE
jgi:hypothetical protein